MIEYLEFLWLIPTKQGNKGRNKGRKFITVASLHLPCVHTFQLSVVMPKVVYKSRNSDVRVLTPQLLYLNSCFMESGHAGVNLTFFSHSLKELFL